MLFFGRVLISCGLMLLTASTVFAQPELHIVTGELPPFVSENPRESMLTELLDTVAAEMGVTFNISFMPWKRCQKTVQKATAWAAFPYARTPVRERDFHYSDSLYTVDVKFFHHRRDGKRKPIVYSALSDLKKHTVGGVIGYYYVNAFREAGIPMDLVTNEEQNVRKLSSGRVDLIIINETVGWYLINKIFPKEEALKFGTVEKPYLTDSAYLITSRKYPGTRALLARFNRALQRTRDSGLYRSLADKHGIITRH